MIVEALGKTDYLCDDCGVTRPKVRIIIGEILLRLCEEDAERLVDEIVNRLRGK